jgi:GNAT superfamily N-acetyltransferase
MTGSSVTEGMFNRALEHERVLSYGAATRVVETQFGSIVLNTEIDEVMTDPPWEGRGYATAVIAAATDYARQQGCEFVFLRTDADDWPQHYVP